ITKTVTYKAIWKYDVTYQAGTGANEGQANQKAIKYSDIDLALLGETYKRTDHAQSGWSLTENGEKAYALGAMYTENVPLTLYPVWSPAGDIDVSVGDENGKPVQGAKVKITQAEQTVPNGTERASDKNGKVAFTDLPYGIYNAVVTYTSGTTKIVVTKAIEINSTSLSISVTLPNVRLNTEVVGTVPVAVEDLESAITEAEKSEITDSTTPGSTSEIRIVLDATPEDTKKITDAMDAAAGKNKALTNYVDVTVTKTLKTIGADGAETVGTSEELKTTAEYQTLSFAILPELAAALAKQDGATVENVLVYRRHVDENSTVTIEPLPKVSAQYGKVAQYDCYYIETVMGIPYIVVRARNFSTYAFGLQEKEIDTFNPYIITFDAVGGIVTPASAAANIDNRLDTLPTPARIGSYRFDGWYTAADGGTKVTTATVFTSNTTLYAHWTYLGGSGDSGDSGDSDNCYIIVAAAGAGGTVSPSGRVPVCEDLDKTFTFTPTKGWVVSDVLVDGVSVGAVPSYTFQNVQKNHTINVVFTARGNAIGLDKVNHFAYMQGYVTGEFGPNKNMTRAEAIVMFSRLLLEKMDLEKSYSCSFRDITGGEWYANAVGYMERFGIISGYLDGTFGGNKPISRAEFAAISTRFDALLLDKPNPFSDVAATHWARDYIASAADKGWITGYTDGTFRPENHITRAEVVTIVNHMLNRKADVAFVNAHKDAVKYSDLQNDQDWFYYNIAEASIGHKYERSADGAELWTSIQK
ncbi:MAG: S-layer homology domain-containing protein, partial [Oscillospiraceae bacterium]